MQIIFLINKKIADGGFFFSIFVFKSSGELTFFSNSNVINDNYIWLIFNRGIWNLKDRDIDIDFF